MSMHSGIDSSQAVHGIFNMEKESKRAEIAMVDGAYKRDVASVCSWGHKVLLAT
jgi:hypothetical protein